MNRIVKWGEFAGQLSLHTAWARFGAVSRFLAARIAPLSPPVLILGLPRSGTSWVGSALGQAANAMYLREPVNQNYQKHGGTDSIVKIDPQSVPPSYRSAAERAFAGIPQFDRWVVAQPSQWGLHDRTRRRLVIKEVNPLAAPWYIERFRPRIVFVMRHPAGIALSHKRLNWGDSADTHYWQKHGAYQGEILRAAWEVLQHDPDCRFVHFEDLCAAPLINFEKLFHFAGLEWDQNVAKWIEQHSAAGERTDAYGIQRKSAEVAQAWRSEITPSALADLQHGFQAFEVPWYQSPDEWRIARL